MKKLLLTVSFTLALAFLCPNAICKEADTEGGKPDSAKPAKVTPTPVKPAPTKVAKAASTPEVEEVPPMTIGSPAPSLDIENWIHDGEGRFPKVTEFEPGKVYVVEFWATWCGPCIASMPHIVELQNKYADRGVQIVSITREDVETVNAFLEREVRQNSRQSDDDNVADDETGEDESDEEPAPLTYRELTKSYCLTSDPDASTNDDYMKAAKQNGIPCAFIVGKDAKIEWIGHPMSIDDALEQVVSDSWDREVYREEFAAKQESRAVITQLSKLLRSKKEDEAIELIDDYIANGKSESSKTQLKSIKLSMLMTRVKTAQAAANRAASEMLADDSLDASGVNQIAWSVYEMSRQNRANKNAVLKMALEATQSAVAGAGTNAVFLMDTIAHLQYQLGDREAALKTQRAAVEAATPEVRSRLAKYLTELENEIADEDGDSQEVDSDNE
ncbi:thiol-disulfide isomerase/thioredoxin [Rhodopirellula rubra]|uniref:Thiol-disulfide isomerase/thioredoxin n=1 Tax=Aporhodopirellula rubra TaxID=980271 RepID=A0A7W5DU73_9BACT|nr:redoxin family protein [Aporhodopirellula rubra]MBB3204644.1 thiol-disulfide isomerase/thioredoxin [Aporhodopirellula rubra]